MCGVAPIIREPLLFPADSWPSFKFITKWFKDYLNVSLTGYHHSILIIHLKKNGPIIPLLLIVSLAVTFLECNGFVSTSSGCYLSPLDGITTVHVTTEPEVIQVRVL